MFSFESCNRLVHKYIFVCFLLQISAINFLLFVQLKKIHTYIYGEKNIVLVLVPRVDYDK